jgi:hypothetical protein
MKARLPRRSFIRKSLVATAAVPAALSLEERALILARASVGDATAPATAVASGDAMPA